MCCPHNLGRSKAGGRRKYFFRNLSHRTGLAQHAEHVFLIDFDARLIERIDVEKINADGAGFEEEVAQDRKSVV